MVQKRTCSKGRRTTAQSLTHSLTHSFPSVPFSLFAIAIDKQDGVGEEEERRASPLFVGYYAIRCDVYDVTDGWEP